MKDFRHPSNTQSVEQEERTLKRQRMVLQILGVPITIFAALAAMAYFADEALLPFLEDRQLALNCLVLSGAAILIEGVVSGWLSVRIARLNRAKKNEGAY